MKTVPLRPSRFPDSGGIFTFANGVRMEEISRFDRQVKQGKIWDADCTCPYSPYGHVEGRTIMVTWQFDDVACLYWMVVAQWSVDTCHLQRIRFGHVAQSIGATCHCVIGLYGCIYVKFIWGVRGVRPPDLPHCQSL
jgi:hypothetical protein